MLAASIKQRLAAVLDSAYLDNALPEYVLVLLANRHDAAKIKAELGSFIGEPQADEFTEWLMKEYEAVRTVVDGVMTSPPHSVKRPVLKASRMFEAAMRDATGVDKQQRMQVEPPSLLSSTSTLFNISSGSSSKENRRRSPDGRVPAKGGRELLSSRRKNSRRLAEERLEREALDRELEAITRPPAPKRILEAKTATVAEEKPRKCQYWPSCKAGDACPFIHPTEPCRFFPTCSFGDQCIYIHPSLPCRFQDKCANPNCNYQHKSPAVNGQASLTVIQPTIRYASYSHPSVAPHHHQMQQGYCHRSAAQATIICRFHPKCFNPQCPFLHPSSTPCRYGEGCARSDCTYTHPTGRHGARSKVNAPCRFGRQCSRVNCPFQHLPFESTATLMEGVTSTVSTNADVGSTKQTASVQAAAETSS